YKNFERHVWHLSQGEQFESVGIECRLTSNEATALLHGALQGMGISMLPTYLSNIYLQSGQLESVLPNWKPNDLNIYALYSSRKHLSPAVRAFIDHSEDYFKQHPW
ncbi:LysR substrate-binding domain-containing protein, partial [Vibrio antiquarius]